jgi:membrane-associated phospholipid phosphatase
MMEILNNSSTEAEQPVLVRQSLPQHMSEQATSLLQSLNLPDRLTLAYLLFTSTLLVICQRRVARWPELLLIHCGLSCAIIALAAFRERGRQITRVLSHWYPLLLPGFFFEEIGALVHAIFPGWFDHLLIAADYALFGAHPTVWIEQFSSYWLTEYMHLVYTLYLPLIPAFGAWLWLGGRRAEFTAFVTAMCVTYYLDFLIFILFPIEGPHHTLAHLQQVELAGGPFTTLINLIEKHGRVHGGAFPSNHIAGSMVVLFAALRFARRLGYALAPLALSICVATVYGRYHYAIDVFAGAVMAWLGCRIALKD